MFIDKISLMKYVPNIFSKKIMQIHVFRNLNNYMYKWLGFFLQLLRDSLLLQIKIAIQLLCQIISQKTLLYRMDTSDTNTFSYYKINMIYYRLET